MKSDSRENIVQKLKRELRKLKEENLTLKQQLGYPSVNNSGRLPKIVTARNGKKNLILRRKIIEQGQIVIYGIMVKNEGFSKNHFNFLFILFI